MFMHGDMRFDKSRYLWESGRRQNGKCPYWEGHRKAQGRRFGRLLFDKWYCRPSRAYALYWRLHPGEERAANAATTTNGEGR